MGVLTVLLPVYRLDTQLCTSALFSPGRYLFFSFTFARGWTYCSASGLQPLDSSKLESVARCLCVAYNPVAQPLHCCARAVSLKVLSVSACLFVSLLNLFNVALLHYVISVRLLVISVSCADRYMFGRNVSRAEWPHRIDHTSNLPVPWVSEFFLLSREWRMKIHFTHSIPARELW